MRQSEKPVRGSAPRPDHILLSFRGDVRTSRAVSWRTSTDVAGGYVLCREVPGEGGSDPGGEWVRTEAETDVFLSDIDVSRLYWAQLTDLRPGTAYEYTCGDGAHRAGPFRFTTAPEQTGPFRFICLSDQQRGEPRDCPDYSGFRRFLRRLLERFPDTAFFLTGGDNTDCGQHEVQWNGLFSGLRGIAESVPFMMALGNHDNRGFRDYARGIGRYYAEPAEYFGRQFRGSYPDNGPANWKTENYTFDYGNAHISVVGINGPEEVNAWLLEDPRPCRADWKLGVYHFPICYSGVDCQNYDAYPVMREGFERFDLVFSGHEHNFSRSFPLRGEELFDRPSQGTVHYMLGNSNSNPPGSRTLSKVWHAAFFPQEEPVSMACVVEIDGPRMTLTSVLDDGRTVDQCVIDKAKDQILPYAAAPRYNRTRMLFKGMDPGLAQADIPCECRDGVWFAPLAALVSFLGGGAEKTPGQVRLEAYGHWARFTEGSAFAATDRGPLALPAPVFRGARGQLYIPARGCAALEMRWAYAPRNNFLSFEHESEDKPVTEQP
ncbi:MAG: metallophosphoesterase family protein [Oscillospiraceae bacterium]|jgi:hypothetical protein|nr:metallophosphoesterase family protein [Oscillospiraceae bacterium]